CRGRWCWRAHVSDEVSDRDVGLVTDGRDRWHRASADRAGDDFFVERPEILDRSAAAADDNDVYSWHFSDGCHRACNLECRALTLHTRRPNDDVSVAIAAAQDLDDVAHGGAFE